MMSDERTSKPTDAVLVALDSAINTGPWEKSNFLKVIGKNLREIRDELAQQLTSDMNKPVDSMPHLRKRAELPKGQQEVYISLYSFDGMNLSSWERIIMNLPRQMISRPIYANENDIKSMIKAKDHRGNEAYVSIYINTNDILPVTDDKLPVDKLGTHLLSLKDNSLKLNNINYVVHESGTYHYVHGRLIKN